MLDKPKRFGFGDGAMNNLFQNLTNLMIANKSRAEKFEIWSNGTTTYGFACKDGLHFCSSETARDFAFAKYV